MERQSTIEWLSRHGPIDADMRTLEAAGEHSDAASDLVGSIIGCLFIDEDATPELLEGTDYALRLMPDGKGLTVVAPNAHRPLGGQPEVVHGAVHWGDVSDQEFEALAHMVAEGFGMDENARSAATDMLDRAIAEQRRMVCYSVRFYAPELGETCGHRAFFPADLEDVEAVFREKHGENLVGFERVTDTGGLPPALRTEAPDGEARDANART